ncbi:hypothetical protein GCM10023331_28880 [Algivirga pacifica]|uniref:Ig-like domain-containing protein n=2 Tax=Algivirga pacifica TaxID=1162670 RepID=A0ABP9DLB4_9BACT
MLNAQALEGNVLIKNGKEVSGITVVNDPDGMVDLLLKANGATEMKISRRSSFDGVRWEPYSSTKNRVPLIRKGEQDGLKFLYAVFRDRNGNVSEVIPIQCELDRTPPYDLSLILNSGSKYTNDKYGIVSVIVSAEEASELRVSITPFIEKAPWRKYMESFKYRLPPGDGLKKIYVQFRDAVGNESKVIDGEVIVDRTGPSRPSVKINEGERFTKDQQVKLKLSAEGASHVQVRGGNGWEEYATEITHELSANDGLKEVYVRYKDEADNFSTVVKAAVILDTTPPKFAKVVVNKGGRYIESEDQQGLQLMAFGATEMMISNYEDFRDGRWEPFKKYAAWRFLPGDGEKFVYVKFRDPAHNESDVAKTKVILDSQPPEVSGIKIMAEGVVINNKDKKKYLKNDTYTVDLELEAEGAMFMMIANNPAFTGARWEQYKPQKVGWVFEKSEGLKTVYAKFMDRARNVTPVISDEVVIDNTPPMAGKLVINNDATYTNHKDKRVKLNLTVAEGDSMMISNRPTFEEAEWESFVQQKAWTLEGDDDIKTVYVKYKDIAGNVSEVYEDNIILDRQPPQDLMLVLDKGAKVTNHPEKMVQLKIRAKEAVRMKLSNDFNLSGVNWTVYTPVNRYWKLKGDDGNKMVYAQFIDEAGNETEVLKASILLDRRPPLETSMEIVGNKEDYSVSQDVTLKMKAEGAVKMMVADNVEFKEASWEPFKPTKKWYFQGGDGLKIVFAKFMDDVGNVSVPVFDRIGLDTEAPAEGSFMVLTDNGKYCTDIGGRVRLRLSVRNADEMLISNNAKFDGADWQRYSPYVTRYYLDAMEDGEKKVYVKYRDNAGNETEPLVRSVILDRQEPVHESVLINGGEKYITENKPVQLTIYAEGATEMMISNSSQFSGAQDKWERYSTNVTWNLAAGQDGIRRVYVKFRDEAGNVSTVASASIIMDTTPPAPYYVKINKGARVTTTTNVNLSIRAAKDDAEKMMVSNSPNFDDNAYWRPYQHDISWPLTSGAGVKRVYVRFSDEAGNISTFITGTITLGGEN